jgi:DinB superfamily
MAAPAHLSDWALLLTKHSEAVEGFRRAADHLTGERWLRPLAPGKWTPAEVTSHVTQAYRVVCGELAGKPGMRLVGSRFRRLILRLTVLPRLLAGQAFPPGVRAPRETRPVDIITDPGEALSKLEEWAHALEHQLTGLASSDRACLSHAYFGPLSARQGIRLLTVHTRHHAWQLEAAGQL